MQNTKSRRENKPRTDKCARWAIAWLDSVARGNSKMSQRKLTALKTRGGGISAVRKLAKTRGVHLVALTDDQGTEIVAASMHPFKILS